MPSKSHGLLGDPDSAVEEEHGDDPFVAPPPPSPTARLRAPDDGPAIGRKRKKKRAEREARQKARVRKPPVRRPRVRKHSRFTSLTFRILALNIIALGVLVGGLLYLDQFREGLVEAKIAALQTEGEIIAGALGESAVIGTENELQLRQDRVGQIVRRLTESTGTRARVFGLDGALLVDTRALTGRKVQARRLPGPDGVAERVFFSTYDRIVDWLPDGPPLPEYVEHNVQLASHYIEVERALTGDTGAMQRVSEGEVVVSVALPVQFFKKVLGALMLTVDTVDIDESVRDVRFAILQVSGLALAVTILLSLFLAGTIARPVRRLAKAADQVHKGLGGRVAIPDFTRRRDEIGDLSAALRDMTEALYRRLDDMEAFAADVAHEIKNPLTSLRSAVEVLENIQDVEKRKKLMAIVREDVGRIDRLISDISDASRLDAELSRAAKKPLDVGAVCAAMAEVYRATAANDAPRLELDMRADRSLVVEGVEDRIAQVVRNVLTNAVSFSPPDGAVRIIVRRAATMALDAGTVQIAIEDEGPGFPPQKIDEAFDRFYSARPKGEAFGQHSGLGLSISRQIIEAHRGRIWAENRIRADGSIAGARVIIRLPMMPLR